MCRLRGLQIACAPGRAADRVTKIKAAGYPAVRVVGNAGAAEAKVRVG
jgi:hypothetical protein